MKNLATHAAVLMAIVVCAVALAAYSRLDAASEMKTTDLPGITRPDKTPRACVDCHVNVPGKADYRLPSILAQWKENVDPRVLPKAKAAAPEGKTIQGKHPDVSAKIKTIPDDCLQCHGRDSRIAPPFAKLLHAIHLVGGEDNHFLAIYKGTCTNCHKLDQRTGAWHIGSGEAK